VEVISLAHTTLVLVAWVLAFSILAAITWLIYDHRRHPLGVDRSAPQNIRLSGEARRLVNRLAEEKGLSRTTIVELAIREYADRQAPVREKSEERQTARAA
jgi:hypothetical protein